LKKNYLQILSLLFFLPGIAGCHKLDGIGYIPALTPAQFLQQQYWVKVHLGDFSFIWSQPSSTLLVYFVGFFAMWAGYRFMKDTQAKPANKYWGTGLLLTGLGALFAGTSYQALGYELKCSGREFCTYTSWFEVIYLLLSGVGLNAFLVAGVQVKVSPGLKRMATIYAGFNTIAYSALLLYGAFTPVRFLVTFDCMILAGLPTVLFLVGLHSLNYLKNKGKYNLHNLQSWLVMIGVALAYGFYLAAGFTQPLWQHGIWFTENDVLHLGMIGWVYFLYKKVKVLTV
jgi:hypothetical protein